MMCVGLFELPAIFNLFTIDDVQDGRIGKQLQLLQAELFQFCAVHFLSGAHTHTHTYKREESK